MTQSFDLTTIIIGIRLAWPNGVWGNSKFSSLEIMASFLNLSNVVIQLLTLKLQQIQWLNHYPLHLISQSPQTGFKVFLWQMILNLLQHPPTQSSLCGEVGSSPIHTQSIYWLNWVHTPVPLSVLSNWVSVTTTGIHSFQTPPFMFWPLFHHFQAVRITPLS